MRDCNATRAPTASAAPMVNGRLGGACIWVILATCSCA
jgi:hypothetical protein